MTVRAVSTKRLPAVLCVDIVGKYEPLPFGFGDKYKKGVKPEDFLRE